MTEADASRGIQVFPLPDGTVEPVLIAEALAAASDPTSGYDGVEAVEFLRSRGLEYLLDEEPDA